MLLYSRQTTHTSASYVQVSISREPHQYCELSNFRFTSSDKWKTVSQHDFNYKFSYNKNVEQTYYFTAPAMMEQLSN